MEEDSKIIDLLYKREEQALIELSEKYGTACKRIAGNILKNHRDAEECVNDTYLAVWNTIPPKNPNPLRAYIFRIIRNISIAKYHENTCIKRNSYYDVALQELENCLIPNLLRHPKMHRGKHETGDAEGTDHRNGLSAAQRPKGRGGICSQRIRKSQT